MQTFDARTIASGQSRRYLEGILARPHRSGVHCHDEPSRCLLAQQPLRDIFSRFRLHLRRRAWPYVTQRILKSYVVPLALQDLELDSQEERCINK